MVSCLCPYRHRLVMVVRVSPDVLGFAVSGALAAAPAVVAHVSPAASSPDPVLCEPEAVAVVAAALRRVHPAAAVALVAPDVQLVLHEPAVQHVGVSQQHEAVGAVVQVAIVPRLAVVPQVAVVPRLAAVPLFVLPAAEARCLDP